MASLRVVWDTNVFISTFLFHGRSSILAQMLFDGRFTLLVSESILEEYFEVAIRPRFRVSHQEVRELLANMAPWMLLIHPPLPLRSQHFLRDPDDAKFLECAVAGRARYLVTGDMDLLSLKHYRSAAIRSVAAFLKIIGNKP